MEISEEENNAKLFSGTILYGAGRKGFINSLGVESREYSEYRGAWGVLLQGSCFSYWDVKIECPSWIVCNHGGKADYPRDLPGWFFPMQSSACPLVKISK